MHETDTISEKMSKLKISAYTEIPLSKLTKDDIGKKICSFGWVWTAKQQGKMTFIDLYAQFRKVKCVAMTQKETLTQWTSLRIYGEVKPNLGKDEYEFEVFVEKYEVFGKSEAFPINSETSQFTMLEKGHLALRTPERILFLKARSHLMRILRDYFYKTDCIEITPPTLVQTQVEGGSTLFPLKYYDKKAYLTQSSQLYLETVVPVCQRAFCIMPSYRAEKSNTRRHLSEYTHVEAELADVNFDDLIDFIEQMVIYTTERFYSELGNEIKKVHPDFEFIKVPPKFKRMKYTEAIKVLQEHKLTKSDGSYFEDKDDIPDHCERWLCDHFKTPIFLTNFLVEHKPFYMRKDDFDTSLTQSLDLLFPTIGETVGGSMRCESHSDLIAGFNREGISPDPYYWYTDMLKYGSFPHGGFGLGFERLLMGLMGYSSINKACLYPRFTTRCSP